MKPMIYGAKRIIEVLDEGYFEDYHYCIISFGTHPAAYIELPRWHQYYGTGNGLQIINSDGFWIGWDYAHFDDYNGFEAIYPEYLQTNGKKWTTEEIFKEIKDVILQLKNIHIPCISDITLLKEVSNPLEE